MQISFSVSNSHKASTYKQLESPYTAKIRVSQTKSVKMSKQKQLKSNFGIAHLQPLDHQAYRTADSFRIPVKTKQFSLTRNSVNESVKAADGMESVKSNSVRPYIEKQLKKLGLHAKVRQQLTERRNSKITKITSKDQEGSVNTKTLNLKDFESSFTLSKRSKSRQKRSTGHNKLKNNQTDFFSSARPKTAKAK